MAYDHIMKAAKEKGQESIGQGEAKAGGVLIWSLEQFK